MRITIRDHELAPRGVKYIMLGIARNYSSSTVKGRDVKISHTVYRQDMSWHPVNSEIQGCSDLSVTSGRKGATAIEKTKRHLTWVSWSCNQDR